MMIVMRPNITATLRMLAPGVSETFEASALGLYGSVSVAVSRLNKAAGRIEYEIETCDNGATYTVTRNPRRQVI